MSIDVKHIDSVFYATTVNDNDGGSQSGVWYSEREYYALDMVTSDEC